VLRGLLGVAVEPEARDLLGHGWSSLSLGCSPTDQ
jgi:hypothetical protein